MSSNRPFISVIIPVLNCAGTIQQCIDSVTTQTYSRKELIVIDGASTDGTVDIIYHNKGHIDCWVSESDRGHFNALNKGLRRAKGDWIIFLGADDYLWSADALADMSRSLATAYPRYCVVYGRVARLSRDGELKRIWGKPWSEMSGSLAFMSLAHQGVLHHRSLFERYGEYDESFRISGDYELFLRHLKTYEPLYVPDIIVSAWREGGVSSSSENQLLHQFERRRAVQKHGIEPAWMSRIELLVYGIHEFISSLAGSQVRNFVLRCGGGVISLDQRLRKY